ncbi:MAG: putative Ig domain-containing protein [Chitinophagaceae bacterium]
MKPFLSFCAALLLSFSLQAQRISLEKGWKFHTGDDPRYDSPQYNDSGWKSMEVGHYWEEEGHPGYDGFAWYRLHVIIPSSLKTESYLKAGFNIELGKIDDGDQVFLNGKLIGQNGGVNAPIEEGSYNQNRVYVLPITDPAIHWDQENLIAVRVFDHGGNGGMYEGPYSMHVMGINDFVDLDIQDHGFHFPSNNWVQKKILLKSTSNRLNMLGTLQLTIIDPATKKSIWEKSLSVSFSKSHPFVYHLSARLPLQQPYQAQYSFKEIHASQAIRKSEDIPYILTPQPSDRPRINGARVVGVRPGHPFLFQIPVTGSRPMTYAASGLPPGLLLNPVTGIVTGKLMEKKTYVVLLTAKNKFGSTHQPLRIVVGDQIGLTPAMGWNSWNCWGLSVSDQKVRAAAEAMKKSGLLEHGWTYINIDDGWEQGRNAAGQIVPNAKFPDMKKLADFVHHLGLKMGIYSSPGPKTCGGYEGSYQHELQDARSYADWGIDYLKYDWCSYGQIAPHADLKQLQHPYRVMRSALNQVNRDILFSFCQYGMGDVWKWGGAIGGNSWRTTGDIRDNWESMSGIGFKQGACAPYAQPGNFNDPDMLVVGKVGWGPSLHYSHLTPDEQYTHISLWCLLSAPLLIGCDMSQLDDFTKSLLTNDEVLAVDQDPLGKEAVQVAQDGPVKVYAKVLADGSHAVGLFNLGDHPIRGILKFSDLGISGSQVVRDLWREKNLGQFTQTFSALIPVHGVVLVKVSPEGKN